MVYWREAASADRPLLLSLMLTPGTLFDVYFTGVDSSYIIRIFETEDCDKILVVKIESYVALGMFCENLTLLHVIS